MGGGAREMVLDIVLIFRCRNGGGRICEITGLHLENRQENHYTVISHHDGLRALKLFLDKHPNQELSVLVRLAELVITLKMFSFESKHYQQISGAVMQGNQNGFQLCFFFVGFVEKQIFEQYTDPIPDYLCSYADDCLGRASCSRVELEHFINFVNNFYPSSIPIGTGDQ
jgi:hypothetical protein